MTHVGERMKLLNCVLQDMEALANILASAPRAVSKYRANVPDQGGRTPGIAQYQHLNNCIPDIPIASPYVS